jgi:DNA polymerase III subunit epsilon
MLDRGRKSQGEQTRRFFRLLLPLATPQEEPGLDLQRHEGRPEFYDFDLFAASERSRAQEDCGWPI